MAAFGLVHVVGGHKHRHPLARQLMDLVPELAPRLGVDAGGGLIEQQKSWRMHDAGRQRQALLPAARQRAGKLVAAGGQPQRLDGAGDVCLHRPQTVEPGDELQVLRNRQVLVEREPLGHVADLVLDHPAVGDDVIAEHRARALVRRQQPAHHADRRGLAGAVGPKEADDLALLAQSSIRDRRRCWHRSA